MAPRRMGACPSSSPRPRLLRSGQRTGLYSTPDHNRLRRQKRHRVIIKERRCQKSLDDQNKKRLRIGKILNVNIVKQIFEHRRPHGKLKVAGHFGQQAGIIFICQILLIQIFIVQIFILRNIGGKHGQDQRVFFNRSINRLIFRKIILRQHPFLLIINHLLKAGKQWQKLKRNDVRRLFVR